MKTLRTLLTWGLLSAATHVMGYSLTVSPIEIEAGQSTNLIINLDDAPDNFTAYQMMVYLPDGVTVQKKTNGKYAYTANADRHDGNFTITVKDAADGSILIACFSADKDVLTGTSGELIRLPLEVASTVTTSLQGSIKNIEFSDVNNNAYNPADVDFALTLKGGSTPPDVSGDVTVSVPDIEITAGSTADLIVNMQTELTNVTAYQMMVYLPDGVTVQKKTNGKYAYTANADRHDGNFTITVKDAADGSVLIACFSADKDVLTGASGELIRLPLEVASTVTTSLQGSIKNIEFSDVNNNAYNPADVDFALTLKGGSTSQIITFADPAVKAICVANWDTNGDGELSEAEAAAVTALGGVFKDNTEITSFNELQYFTGLTSIGNRAFYGCSSLTSITIPSSVTSIGDQSFMYCKGFTSLNLPDNLTSIGNEAFEDCSGLTSVNIPGKVTAIGWFAFAGCRLTSVFIPDSVTAIGSGAFCCDNSITSIKVGEGNKYFDSRNNCNAIIETATNKLIAACKNSFIPDGIKTIGGNAFCNCIDLSSITIPNSVTSIGEEAFAGTGLTFISIPNSVEKIVSEAFYGCENLTNVIIGNGVTSIGSRAFKHCSNLTDVYCYAENVPTTNGEAFDNSPIASATLHVPAGSVEAYKAIAPWSGFGTIVAIEDVAKNITFADPAVKALCVANWDTNGDGELSKEEAAAVTDLREVFKSNKEITSFNELQYFTGLTSIGNHAFYGCSALTSVIIPESVTSIDEEAFGNCKGLISINIPNSVTSIGNYAFEYCSGLTSIVVESGNKVYDSRDNCNAIIETASNTLIAGCMNTIIPESVTSISDNAFRGCSALTSIIIPESVTRICSSAFSGCSSLTSVTIPNSVTSISNWAFAGCSGLTNITIPNGVTYIGVGPLEDCSSLTSIAVESGNTKYDSRDDCNAIIETASNTLIAGCKNTIIPETVTSIYAQAFYGCSGLTSVIIPNSVTSIGYWAFSYCSGLTSITIPESVTNIDSFAFYGCTGLTSVTIGSGVTNIGNYAFIYCHGLQSIICYAKETPEVSENTFNGVDVSNVTLQVPRESVQKYKDHPVWGKFKIVEVITGIDEVEDAMPKAEVEDAIYDLSGKAVNGNLPHGIYIRNGKKVAVK